MNLSKILKQKRDAEDRLRNRSPVTVFTEAVAGEQSFKSTEDFATKTELEGKAEIDHNHDLDYADIIHNHDEIYVKIGQSVTVKYYEPITNGDLLAPEFLFYEGDVIMGEVI